MYNYFKLKVLLVTIAFLMGCSTLEEKVVVSGYAPDYALICSPTEAQMCIGWAGNTD